MDNQCCKNCTHGFEVEPNKHNNYKDHYCGRFNIYVNGGDYCINHKDKEDGENEIN